MMIIDSLLKFNFFSLERCRRTSLFFRQATLSRHLSSKLELAELGPVIGLIGAKHGEQSVQEFTHYGYDRLETCFAATEQTLIEGPQMTLGPQRHSRPPLPVTPPIATAP